MKIHDKVIIGGRTMLRPGYSLVGKSGTVFALGSAHDDVCQVMVDDEIMEAPDGGQMALVVNVPIMYLTMVEANADEESSAPEPSESRPGLRMI